MGSLRKGAIIARSFAELCESGGRELAPSTRNSSPGGANDLSPALQRWESRRNNSNERV